MFLYSCKQVFVEAQIFTSGNISVANQNDVSKVQQVRYWIPYSCIIRPYIARVCGFAQGKAECKTTNWIEKHAYPLSETLIAMATVKNKTKKKQNFKAWGSACLQNFTVTAWKEL